MPDFSKLLNTKIDDDKKPSLLPPGTYEAIIEGYTLGETPSEQKTPFVQFNFRLTAPGADIEQEDLVDTEGKPIDVSSRRTRTSFYLTPDARYRLAEFIKSLGIDTADRGYAETLPETKNQPVLLTMNNVADTKGKVDKDGNPEMYANVVRAVGTANVTS